MLEKGSGSKVHSSISLILLPDKSLLQLGHKMLIPFALLCLHSFALMLAASSPFLITLTVFLSDLNLQWCRTCDDPPAKQGLSSPGFLFYLWSHQNYVRACLDIALLKVVLTPQNVGPQKEQEFSLQTVLQHQEPSSAVPASRNPGGTKPRCWVGWAAHCAYRCFSRNSLPLNGASLPLGHCPWGC